MNAATASSYSGSGLIQLVWTFASCSAFSMYAWIRLAKRTPVRAGPRGQAPTSVW